MDTSKLVTKITYFDPVRARNAIKFTCVETGVTHSYPLMDKHTPSHDVLQALELVFWENRNLFLQNMVNQQKQTAPVQNPVKTAQE